MGGLNGPCFFQQIEIPNLKFVRQFGETKKLQLKKIGATKIKRDPLIGGKLGGPDP